MKTILIFLGALAAPLFAQANYVCSYDEAGFGLKYETRIQLHAGGQAADVQTLFVVEDEAHPACASLAPFAVTMNAGRIELAGRFLCEDRTEHDAVLSYDPRANELAIGNRIEKCQRVP